MPQFPKQPALKEFSSRDKRHFPNGILLGLYKDLRSVDIPQGGFQEMNNFHTLEERIEKYKGWTKIVLSSFANLCPCGGELVPADTVLSFAPVTGAVRYEIEIYSGLTCEGTPVLQETIDA